MFTATPNASSLTNFKSGKKQGASTITQQVAKNFLLSPEQTFERKAKEALIAFRIEAARLLTYKAAWMKDRGERTTRESSVAKLYASEIAVRSAEDAVQIFGGYGFVKDYPAEKYFRDVKLTTIGEGTSEIQRLVIARQLLAS